MKSSPDIPQSIAEISSAWLTSALREGGCLTKASVTAIETKTLGAGVGFLDQVARIRLTYDRTEAAAPASVIVKASSGLRGRAR